MRDLASACQKISAGPAPLTHAGDVTIVLNRELPFDGATSLLAQAAPGDPLWQNNLMLMYRRHEDFPQAAAIADKIGANDLANGNEEFWALASSNRADVYALAGQNDKALEICKSLEINDKFIISACTGPTSDCTADALKPADLAAFGKWH